MVQLNLARKFTVWGLFSIFDLIYSCVIISDSSGSAYVGQGFIDIDVHPSTLQEKGKWGGQTDRGPQQTCRKRSGERPRARV